MPSPSTGPQKVGTRQQHLGPDADVVCRMPYAVCLLRRNMRRAYCLLVWGYGHSDMVTHMKTTVELPDALLQAVRERASRDGVPMRDVMVEALRRELERRESETPRVDFVFPTSTAAGWLVNGLHLTQAIHESYA